MKKKKEFLKDLNKNREPKIPFVEYFKNDKQLKKELFNQYVKTDLKPSLSLYQNKYYSDIEINKRIIENNFDNEYSKIKTEYNNLIIENKLPIKYYKHSISNTEIVSILNEINICIEDFENIVLKSTEYKPIDFAKSFTNELIYKLEKIGIPKLTQIVLNSFLEVEENTFIEFEKIVHENNFEIKKGVSYEDVKARYREIKRYANDFVRDYLNKNIVTEEQLKPEDKIEFKFENKFDHVEPKKVYEYFYKLVEKGYLSKEDLESYLILAFQDKTPPKEKITFSKKHIGNITAIFYKYYTDADSPHGKQKQYAELLGEYFKSFTTQKVINNFAKSK